MSELYLDTKNIIIILQLYTLNPFKTIFLLFIFLFKIKFTSCRLLNFFANVFLRIIVRVTFEFYNS